MKVSGTRPPHRSLNLNCYKLRTRRQNERTSADPTLSLPHTTLTHDLRTACCFSAQNRGCGLRHPLWDELKKGHLSRWPRIPGRGALPMSDLCRCHIHVLAVSDRCHPACPIRAEPQRATSEKAPGQLVRHIQGSCSYTKLIPHMPLPRSGNFQHTKSSLGSGVGNWCHPLIHGASSLVGRQLINNQTNQTIMSYNCHRAIEERNSEPGEGVSSCFTLQPCQRVVNSCGLNVTSIQPFPY